jgi:signal peptidase II
MYKKNFYSFLLIIFIFIIDRLSKFSIIKLAKNNDQLDLYLTDFLSLKLIWNEGIAFGLLSFNDKLIYNIVTSIILIVITIIFFMLIKSNGVQRFSLILIIGGALGNLFDRLYYSAVPDYIDFHYGSFHWFIFNVADIFITLGVSILIFYEMLLKKKNENS